MSPRQMHSSYRQPRPFLVPSQTPVSRAPPYNNPYNAPAATYHAVQLQNRQPASDSGFRFPFNMPHFSSMTNSALIDALLTPSTNEQEQEHGNRAFPLSASFQDARASVKHTLSPADPVDELFESSDQDHCIETRKQARDVTEQRPRKQQKRKSAAPVELDNDYFDEAPISDTSSPQRARKPRRSTRPKKLSAPVDPPTPEDDYPPPRKEQKLKIPTVVNKPKKARTGRLIRKKPVGTAVPKTLNEAGPADRMMWEWKNQGRNWEEIRGEWKRLTGVEPGGSSLSVRYIKLVENLARNGAAGDIELLRFKREAEEELLSYLWPKVAEKMLAFSPESEHNPKDLQKRYNMIVRSGYDVEKLITDDRIKLENEPKQTLHHMKAGEYPGDFHMDLSAIASYNNPAANEGLAHLRDHETSASDGHNSQSQYTEGQSAIPENDDANIFARNHVLNQQVDGLSEHTHIDAAGYHALNGHTTKHSNSSVVYARESPSDMQKSKFGQRGHTSYLPASSSLVDYGSDSE